MLQIKKDYLEDVFWKYDKVVLFGAGSLTSVMFEAYKELRFEEKVAYIIDNDKSRDGTKILVNGKDILIVSVETFSKIQLKDYALLIMPVFMLDIVEQIDRLPAFHDVPTYIYAFLMNMGSEDTFSFRTTIKPRIPKVIHYLWFGKHELPDTYKKNIESWKRYCPGYEIIEWTEKDYDIGKNIFMRQAYERKSWAYVTDYARKDILYQYGGIYLDTDVELIKPIDELLYNDFFVGRDDVANISSGAGFGAAKGNGLVKALRDDYADRRFVDDDGRIIGRACGVYETALLARFGYRPDDRYQMVMGGSIFPREVLCPISWIGMPDRYTQRTLSIHKYDDLLIDSKGKENASACREAIKGLLRRGGYSVSDGAG